MPERQSPNKEFLSTGIFDDSNIMRCMFGMIQIVRFTCFAIHHRWSHTKPKPIRKAHADSSTAPWWVCFYAACHRIIRNYMITAIVITKMVKHGLICVRNGHFSETVITWCFRSPTEEFQIHPLSIMTGNCQNLCWSPKNGWLHPFVITGSQRIVFRLASRPYIPGFPVRR